jgi:hypothetical protein
MKLKQVTKIYQALEAVLNYKFDSFSTTYAITKLYKRLRIEYEFYMQEQQKILADYALVDENSCFIPNERGGYSFATPEADYECGKKIQELQEFEVKDIEIKPIEITENDVTKNEMTPQTLINLDGVVFVREE